MTVIKLVQGDDGVWMTPGDARAEALERLAAALGALGPPEFGFEPDERYAAARRMRLDCLYGMSVVRCDKLAIITVASVV